MKSRYCAFARGEVDYIIKTTHPDNPAFESDLAKWKRELLEFSKSTQFKGLKILSVDESMNSVRATVTFTVNLIQQGRQADFTEQSKFEKVNGRWLYLDGVIQQQAQAVLEAPDFSL